MSKKGVNLSRVTTRSHEFAANATNSESHRSTRCQEVGGGFSGRKLDYINSGDLVIITGLQKASHHNCKVGVVQEKAVGKNRVVVMLAKGENSLSVPYCVKLVFF